MKKIGLFLGTFACALMVPFMGAEATFVEGEGAIDYPGSGVTVERGEDSVYKLQLTANADEDLIIRDGETVILDLNGFTLTNYAAANSAITVEKGGSLTIIDSKGNGIIEKKDESNTPTVNNQGILVVTAGTITADGLDSAKSAALHNSGALTITGGVITTKEDGVFGLVNEGTATISGGKFIQAHNFSVVNNANKMEITGGEFTISDGNTGAYSLITNQGSTDNASLTVTGGSFKANGGVFFNDKEDVISVSGGTYSHDVSDYLADGFEVKEENGKFVLAKEEPTTNEDKKDEVKDEVENPKTSDGIILVFGALAGSAVLAFVAKKKLA